MTPGQDNGGASENERGRVTRSSSRPEIGAAIRASCLAQHPSSASG
jgi:hypothetical protein